MICPFCNFKRTNIHTNPVWECPSCKKAYNKHKSQINSDLKTSISSDKSISITIMDVVRILIGVILLWFGYGNITSDRVELWGIIFLVVGSLTLLSMFSSSSHQSSSNHYGGFFGGGDSGGDCGGGDGGGGGGE